MTYFDLSCQSNSWLYLTIHTWRSGKVCDQVNPNWRRKKALPSNLPGIYLAALKPINVKCVTGCRQNAKSAVSFITNFSAFTLISHTLTSSSQPRLPLSILLYQSHSRCRAYGMSSISDVDQHHLVFSNSIYSWRYSVCTVGFLTPSDSNF